MSLFKITSFKAILGDVSTRYLNDQYKTAILAYMTWRCVSKLLEFSAVTIEDYEIP